MTKLRKQDLIQIKVASQQLSLLGQQAKKLFLKRLSLAIKLSKKEILSANKKDVEVAKISGMSNAMVQRLILTNLGVQSLRNKIHEVGELDSGLGQVLEQRTVQNNILLKKVSVPLGVIFVIYESRPEVTTEAVSLCVMSGNAVILKGGSEAKRTNDVLALCVSRALRESGLSQTIVTAVSDRSEVSYLLKQDAYIDLVVARGGYELVNRVKKHSTIPVLAHAAGGARIYVDKSADLKVARRVIVNAKVSKPAACNSLDTIVIHKDVAQNFIQKVVDSLREYGVNIVGDKAARVYAEMGVANITDWSREFLGLSVAIKIVDSASEAISFIMKYTKGHSEGIVAKDAAIIKKFTRSVDAAAIFINCSTRLHDGYVFGLGSEMGIATGKLHARGPVGLKELTTYRWEVYGNGNIRE